MYYTSSVLRESRRMKQKEKITHCYKDQNSRLQKLSMIITISPLNTATTLFNEPDRNGHSALLIDKKYFPRLAWFLSQMIMWLTTDRNVQRKKSSMPTQVSSGGNVKRSNSVKKSLHYTCGTINYAVFSC